MNLSELIHKIWEDEEIRKRKIRKSDVEIIMKSFVRIAVSSLFKYGQLKMQGLFTLGIKRIKGRTIGHPQTKEEMEIDDYYKVTLKPSKAIKDRLKSMKWGQSMADETIYLIDTNALLNNPNILDDRKIVASQVFREIDNLELKYKSNHDLQKRIRVAKNKLSNVSYSADIRDINLRYVTSKLIEDGLIYVSDIDKFLDYVDNELLVMAIFKGYGIITDDILLQLKCSHYKVPFRGSQEDIDISDEYTGYKIDYLVQSECNDIYNNLDKNTYDLKVNEYLIIYDDMSLEGKDELLDIFKWTGSHLVSVQNPLNGFSSDAFGRFTPLDPFQAIAVDSVMSNKVTKISGKAGTGKSMITLESSWHLIERGEFDKLVVFANPTPTRNAVELGYYQGGKISKLLQSSVGAMLKSKFGDEIEVLKQIEFGKLDIMPFTDIRGYDTGDTKTIIWISEAQNLTSDLMKLALQRASDSAKVIIDGDYHQQVDMDIYATDSGMKRVSEVFVGEDIYGEVRLENIYRSETAKIADKM